MLLVKCTHVVNRDRLERRDVPRRPSGVGVPVKHGSPERTRAQPAIVVASLDELALTLAQELPELALVERRLTQHAREQIDERFDVAAYHFKPEAADAEPDFARHLASECIDGFFDFTRRK